MENTFQKRFPVILVGFLLFIVVVLFFRDLFYGDHNAKDRAAASGTAQASSTAAWASGTTSSTGVTASGTSSARSSSAQTAGGETVSSGLHSAQLLNDSGNKLAMSTDNLDPKAVSLLLNGLNDTIFTAPVALTAEKPLAGKIKLTRTYAEALPAGAVATFAYYDKGRQAWLPAQSELSADRETLTAEVDQPYVYTDLVTGPQTVIDSVSQSWRDAKTMVKPSSELAADSPQNLTDVAYTGAISRVETGTVQPECKGEVPAWAGSDVVKAALTESDPVQWCVGTSSNDPNVLEVRMANNLGFPLRVQWNAPPANVTQEGTNTYLSAYLTDMQIQQYNLKHESETFVAPNMTKVIRFTQPQNAQEKVELTFGSARPVDEQGFVLAQKLLAANVDKDKVTTMFQCVLNSGDTADAANANAAADTLKSCLGDELRADSKIDSIFATAPIDRKALQYLATTALPSRG